MARSDKALKAMYLGGVVLECDRPVPMSDGTILRADIYRPERPGRYPVLLQRTPYNKATAQTGVYQHPAWYARQGYIVVIQDTRGRFASGGSFEPYRDEARDGADTIGWAAQVDGSTGKVGTFGFSYAGANQLLAAQRKPAGLVCASVGCAGTDFFDGWTYRGGALQLAFILSWSLQALAGPDALKRGDRAAALKIRAIASDMHAAYERPLAEWIGSGDLPDFFAKWITGDTHNAYWKSLSADASLCDIEIPCLHMGGWYDIFLSSTLKTYEALNGFAADDPARAQFLTVGPWQHVPWSRLNGSMDYGADGDNCADELQIAWFDHWLKDKPLGRETAAVRYFLIGADKWDSDTAWPPSDVRLQELYLRSSGSASRKLTDGRLSPNLPEDEPPDIFLYDPGEPVPSVGGASCCRPDIAPIGAFDQRKVESRTDVLVYTTALLQNDCDVVGPVELILYAATDVPDTDWTAKLVDVHPDGRAINVCDGIIRARYRNSLEEPTLLEVGKVYEYRISIGATATRFRAGHAIRLEISSSNFPNYDVNLNRGSSSHLVDLLDATVATQVVLHNLAYPSHLKLMVRGDLPESIEELGDP
jgi:putative CocE/NonD family hydrolase